MAATDSPLGVAVCDAGPIIHLYELDCLDLLTDFSDLLLPLSVAAEVRKHRPTALPKLRAQQTAPAGLPSRDLDAITRAIGLHQGEKDALHIAQSRPGTILLSDDAAARLAARKLRIVTHGTLGLLVRSLRRGQRTKAEVVAILKSIPVRSTLHIRSALLSEFIHEVEQSQ